MEDALARSGTRRLILLRHAKSDRPAGVGDLDRPLNPRGRRTAPLVGSYMAGEGLKPDHVLVSPSRRTRETWEAVAESLGDLPCEIAGDIYEAPVESLLAVIRSAPDEAGTLLVIGHNPGLQELATQLVGDGPKDLCRRLAAEFPTATLAVIDLSIDAWAGIDAGAGRLERFVRPRDIAGEDAD